MWTLSLTHTHTVRVPFRAVPGPRPPSVYNVLRISRAHDVLAERTDEEEDIK